MMKKHGYGGDSAILQSRTERAKLRNLRRGVWSEEEEYDKSKSNESKSNAEEKEIFASENNEIRDD